MIRKAKEDATLIVPSVNGVERTEHLALKKGTMVSYSFENPCLLIQLLSGDSGRHWPSFV